MTATSQAYYQRAIGISAQTGYGNISIVNSGKVTSSYYAIATHSLFGNTQIDNSGELKASVDGIYATAGLGNIDIINTGDITAGLHGIHAYAGCGSASLGPFTPSRCYGEGDISITNTAKVDAGEIGILAGGGTTHITIRTSGDITAGYAGIFAFAAYDKSSIAVSNSAKITAGDIGILAATGFYNYNRGSCGCYYTGPDLVPSGYDANSPISIGNTGIIDPAVGIVAATIGPNSPIEIENAGKVEATFAGIVGATYGENSPIHIINSGTVTTSGGVGAANLPIKAYGSGYSVAIVAAALGANSDVIVENKGDVKGKGNFGVGILAFTYGAGSKNLITNSGSVYGGYAAVLAASATGTTIVNTGKISAGSNFAIGVYGGPATIYNAGHITGFVVLDADDTFINEKGGVFETKDTSNFDAFETGGTDLFRNEEGGVVLAATDPSVKETSGFEGLERFENKGIISLQDDSEGDVFFIANSYGATPEFVGSGKSELAIDAFLGGPRSTADNLIIDGNVSGKTKVDVNDTNAGPGVFNKMGIPVVYVNGPNVTGNEFFLSQPIDTGFFNYDLFFRPTGIGVFELRSFLGQGAFVLPQLITAA